MTETPPLEPAQPSAASLPKLQRTASMDNQGPPPSTTAAGWALGLALVPMPLAWIASVVLAIQVLGKSKYSPGHGKGMAVAALIIVPLWIVATIGFFALGAFSSADRDDTGTITSQGKVFVTDLEAGDCVVENLAEGEFSRVEVAPCAKSHFFETFATFTLPDGDFPGDAAVDQLAGDGCYDRFADFVGVSFDDSKLEMTYMTPLKATWSSDRGVACLITEEAATTGTLEGAKR